MEDRRSWDSMALIEAALYAAGRPLGWRELASVIRVNSREVVLSLARRLMEEYRRRGGALEVVELEGERFALQLKPDYAQRVRRVARGIPSLGVLRTLAYIAYHQPVSQSRVIKARGSHAYKHLKQLEEMGLITREKVKGGRKIIRATELLAECLNLSKNPRIMKRQLRERLKAGDLREYYR